MAVNMSKKDQDAIAAAGAAWTAAKAAGDKAGMEAAHAKAESIRNSYGYSGGDDGTQHIPTSSKSSGTSSGSSGNSQYKAVGKGSDYYSTQHMSASDQALLKSYGDAYNNATTDAERAAAHAAAEKLRAQYGYSGGGDGSEYILLPQEEEKVVASNPSFSYSTPAPTYQDNYSARIDALLNQILNRDKFSYNAAEDDLYQQYKSQYEREGQRAMKDTLGEVSARTGGMASSWAGSMGQQTYDYYASQVADKVPELYQLAYEMYLDDIDLQVRDAGLLQDMSDTQYNRYRDTMSDWRDDRDFAYGVYRDDVADGQWQQQFDYNASRDEVADGQWQQSFDYNVSRDQIADQRYDQEWEYNVGRDAVEDSRYDNETAYERALELLSAGVMPDNSMLTEAGLTAAQASTILAKQKQAVSSKSSGGSGSKKSTTTKNDDGDTYVYGKTEEESTDKFWDSMLDLGIGMVSATYVAELAKYGGIIENADGTVQWANGWTPTNYKDKLLAAKSSGFGILNGLF